MKAARVVQKAVDVMALELWPKKLLNLPRSNMPNVATNRQAPPSTQGCEDVVQRASTRLEGGNAAICVLYEPCGLVEKPSKTTRRVFRPEKNTQ